MKKILIVESEYIYLTVLKNLFSDEVKYEVFIAKNIEEGINITTKHEVDIVLLDTNLEDGDAKKLIQYIREVKKELFSYIFLITTEVNEETISEFYKLGADLYMQKPINPNILKFTVQRLSERINNKNNN